MRRRIKGVEAQNETRVSSAGSIECGTDAAAHSVEVLKGVKFSANRKELLRLAQRAARTTDPKSSINVLGSILLVADAGLVTARTTDLYLETIVTAVAEVERPGSVVVKAKDLASGLRNMTGERVTLEEVGVTLEEVGVTLEVGDGGSTFKLHATDASDFPPEKPRNVPAGELVEFRIPRAELLGWFAPVVHAVSEDETRPHLNSVLLEWGGGVRRAVATDGHRLVRHDSPGPDGSRHKTLLSLQAVEELRRVLDKELAKDAIVSVAASERAVWFSTPGWSYSTRPVAATFPPYDQVTPKVVHRVVRFDRKALYAAVKAAILGSSILRKDKRGNNVIDRGRRWGGITIQPCGDSKVQLSSQTCDNTGASTNVDARALRLDFPRLGINGYYLLDALAEVPTDDVEVGFTAELGPIVIRPAGTRDFCVDYTGFFGIIMPMRV